MKPYNEIIFIDRSKNMKLIPSEGKNTANYWCSWRNQRFFMPNAFLHMRTYDIPNHDIVQREMLSDEFLFGKRGVLSEYMQDVRKDMYVVLDDGWDVPYNGDYYAFGSLILNEERFPYGGKTPAENLAILNKKILDLGYAGTGLWVPMSCIGETKDEPFSLDQFKEYWIERAKWLSYAGIAYLKVDWGIHERDVDYRRALTEIFKEYAPDVTVEHAILDSWFFNPNDDKEKLANTLKISDTFRCYDVKFDFNSVTSLGRAHAMLTLDCDMDYDCGGIINVGEEPYLAASLGCTMGIMSHPLLRGSIITMLPSDIMKNGISKQATLKSEFHSFDHYQRALRWQRIAPAMTFKKGETVSSNEWLTDSWTYEKEPYPYTQNAYAGKSIRQTAPKIVARNTSLPEILDTRPRHYLMEHHPYVVASVNRETGVYTIATLPRTIDGIMNCTTPEVDIAARGISADKCFGVFGLYRSLTLEFDRCIEGMRLFGGDILLDEQKDITDLEGVHIEGNTLRLDGALLSQIGLEGAAFHDIADPGSVFKLV